MFILTLAHPRLSPTIIASFACILCSHRCQLVNPTESIALGPHAAMHQAGPSADAGSSQPPPPPPPPSHSGGYPQEDMYASSPKSPFGDDLEAGAPPPPLDGDERRGDVDDLSKRDLDKYLLLGVFIGLICNFFSFFTLCCFPALERNPRAKKRYLAGLIPAAIIGMFIDILIGYRFIPLLWGSGVLTTRV